MGRNYRPAMEPAEGGPKLSEVPAERLAFACETCGRQGSYRRARLLDEFGDVAIAGLPLLVAERRKCVRAVFPPWPSAADYQQRICGAHLVEPAR